MSDDRLSFGEIICEVSSSRYWPADRIAQALYSAFWNGCFERDGNSCLWLKGLAPGSRYEKVDRMLILRLWPIGAFGPEKFAKLDTECPNEDVWNAVAEFLVAEYDPDWRREVLDRLFISRDDYVSFRRQQRQEGNSLPLPKRWAPKPDASLPKRPGPRSLGDYTDDVRRRIEERKVKLDSPTAVADEWNYQIERLKEEGVSVDATTRSSMERRIREIVRRSRRRKGGQFSAE